MSNTHNQCRGDWRVKRRITLSKAPDPDRSDLLIKTLMDQPGVEQARVRGRSVSVRYDLTKTDYDTLCDRLRELPQQGLRRDVSRWAQWLAYWHQYSDQTGKKNAALPPAACCNRAPPRGKR